jgi:hypothetical protein
MALRASFAESADEDRHQDLAIGDSFADGDPLKSVAV